MKQQNLDLEIIPLEDRKELTFYAQKYSIDQLEDMIEQSKPIWEKYLDFFPEFLEIEQSLNQRRGYFSEDSNALMRYISSGQKTETQKNIEKEIRRSQKHLIAKLNQSIKKWKRLFLEWKQNPNKKGQHYKIAEELANEYAGLWFINKVILFGSVAKGCEKNTSDIDMALHFAPKRKAAGLQRICTVIQDEYVERYESYFNNVSPINLVYYNRQMNKLGYFDDSIILTEAPDLVVKLDGGQYVFKKSSIKEYDLSKYRNIANCVIEDDNSDLWGVAIMNNTPVMLSKIKLYEPSENSDAIVFIELVDLSISRLSELLDGKNPKYLSAEFFSPLMNVVSKVFKEQFDKDYPYTNLQEWKENICDRFQR